LSQQIRKLEDELGTRLFDRLGRTVRLTQFGQLLLPRAEGILRQVDEAKLEIQEMAGSEQGKLVIGAIPTIAPYFLPDRLASFARKFPLVEISVIEEVTSELLQLVHRGSIDLALLALPVASAHCLCRELFRERMFLAVPERHRLAGLSQVRLAEIENDPFLLLKEGHCFRENTLAVCGRARLKPNVVFESGQFTTILAMVATGIGVSVVPEMAVEPISGCRFVPLSDEKAYRRVGVLQLKQRFHSRVDRAFLEHLQAGERQRRDRLCAMRG
jgi:LysR family hydrogen peroxide-inducible transcriptional activator